MQALMVISKEIFEFLKLLVIIVYLEPIFDLPVLFPVCIESEWG